jgi:DNA-binding transcriptional regulator YiaG
VYRQLATRSATISAAIGRLLQIRDSGNVNCMSDWTRAVNEQIRKLARREIKNATTHGRKMSAQHRRDIAALKRQINALHREIKAIGRGSAKSPDGPEPNHDGKPMRFRADGLRSHRKRLDLSAAEYAKLVGVSALTVYNWESGKSKPRRSQLEKIASLRGLGKREAMRRLDVEN